MSPAPAAVAPVRRRDIRPTADHRQTGSAAAILQAALDHGPVARSSVARLAGLSAPAVSRLCAQLASAGLLRDAPEAAPPSGPGRPHVPVDVDTGRLVAGGLHVAAGGVTLALLDLRGRVVGRERLAHASTEPAAVLGRAARRLTELVAGHAGGRPLLGLGVAAGGWVDPAAGRIVAHPALGWRDVPARDILAAATGLPVAVDNHSRALARAERLFGDARSRASVVHLIVGNVVDAAFATGTTVHRGPQSAAGTVAHLPLGQPGEPCSCGRHGCFQAAVSSQALARRAAAAGITSEPSFAGLLAAARAGGQRATGLFLDRARLIGAAAALLLDMLNPELLVVAEAGVAHLPQCLDVLRAEVAARSAAATDPGRSVVATSFGADAACVAGGAVILDDMYADPFRAGIRLGRPSSGAGEN